MQLGPDGASVVVLVLLMLVLVRVVVVVRRRMLPCLRIYPQTTTTQ